MNHYLSHPDNDARRAQFAAHFPYKARTNPDIPKEDNLDVVWQKINEKIKEKNEKTE
jgi:hypothetical protein